MPKQKWTGRIDLNSSRQELSNGGLGIVVTLLVRWQIIFCVRFANRQSSCTQFRTIRGYSRHRSKENSTVHTKKKLRRKF